MATVRTFHSTARQLKMRLPIGRAYATVDPDTAGIAVVLRTTDDSGAAVDAVRGAVCRTEGGRCLLAVPDIPGAAVSAGNIAVSGDRVVEAFVVHQTLTVVNGQVTGMGFGNGATAPGGSPVRSPVVAEIRLPTDAGLYFDGIAASLTTAGHLPSLEARTVSGDVSAASVGTMCSRSVSGCIEVEAVFGRLDARSVSGEIAVGSHQGHDAQISTTSGNVRINIGGAARGTVTVRSLFGDVRVRGARHLAVTATTFGGSRQVE